MEAELANERRQKDFLAAQLKQSESSDAQEKDVTISRLEIEIKEHRMLCEKLQKESVSKETIIAQMRTKMKTAETELREVREESKKAAVTQVDTSKQEALKGDLDSANERIKELEISHEVLREKKTQLEKEFGGAQEKARNLESTLRARALKQVEREETTKVAQMELIKVGVLYIVLKGPCTS